MEVSVQSPNDTSVDLIILMNGIPVLVLSTYLAQRTSAPSDVARRCKLAYRCSVTSLTSQVIVSRSFCPFRAPAYALLCHWRRRRFCRCVENARRRAWMSCGAYSRGMYTFSEASSVAARATGSRLQLYLLGAYGKASLPGNATARILSTDDALSASKSIPPRVGEHPSDVTNTRCYQFDLSRDLDLFAM